MYRSLEDIDTGLKKEVIKQIQDVMSKFLGIEQAILYGSRAMETYRNGSDIDLCLIGKTINSSVVLRIDDLLDNLLLPYSFDISVYDKIDNQNFKDHIDRVGVCFYIGNSGVPR